MTGLNRLGSAYTADLYYGDTTYNSTLCHQRIKNKTEEIRHNEKKAVKEAESNEEIDLLLRRM